MNKTTPDGLCNSKCILSGWGQAFEVCSYPPKEL